MEDPDSRFGFLKEARDRLEKQGRYRAMLQVSRFSIEPKCVGKIETKVGGREMTLVKDAMLQVDVQGADAEPIDLRCRYQASYLRDQTASYLPDQTARLIAPITHVRSTGQGAARNPVLVLSACGGSA